MYFKPGHILALDCLAADRAKTCYPQTAAYSISSPPIEIFYPIRSMNKFQHFAHRPPSNTTLLRDPWPPELPFHQIEKPRFRLRALTDQLMSRVRGLQGRASE
jgi:hypothetical protein